MEVLHTKECLNILLEMYSDHFDPKVDLHEDEEFDPAADAHSLLCQDKVIFTDTTIYLPIRPFDLVLTFLFCELTSFSSSYKEEKHEKITRKT
jgi:hypothetical protein